jgi:hypothetical protein
MSWNKGWHRGKATDFAISVSDTGTEAIAIQLQVTEGDPSGDEGKTITTYLYCTDAAIDNTVAALRLLGWTGDDLGVFGTDGEYSLEELLPNEVSFPIDFEEYNGNSQAKVGKICKASSGKIAVKTRLEGTAAKQFGQRFRSACAANPAEGGAKPRNAPAAARPAAQRRPPVDPTVSEPPEGFPF